MKNLRAPKPTQAPQVHLPRRPTTKPQPSTPMTKPPPPDFTSPKRDAQPDHAYDSIDEYPQFTAPVSGDC